MKTQTFLPGPAQMRENRQGVVETYRVYLGEVLGEVLKTTIPMTPGLERLCAGIEAYWDACFPRRDARLQVMQASGEPGVDEAILRISRPFGHLLYSELLHSGCTNAPVQAGYLFAAVRGIAQDEARSGERAGPQRAKLQQAIRASLAAPTPR